LYVVATPIGNLADLSLRAIHVLGLVDALACEDTRVSAGLMRHLGLDKPLLSVHEHNERAGASAVLGRLADGQRVAYVSDAGTPAVSDPGAVLVAAARAAGYRCIPIPGASSALAALSVAGDAAVGPFRVIGFIEARGAERDRALRAAAADAEAQVLFESPHRIGALSAALAEACPERSVTIARELTKQFESVHTLAARDLPEWLVADPNRQRGEFVLILHRVEAAARQDETAFDQTLRPLLAALPLKQAVAVAVELTAAPRNALYERALHLKKLDDQGLT
jgi:16S rRNA (cytidine1402-2'-O)-methyltransferase